MNSISVFVCKNNEEWNPAVLRGSGSVLQRHSSDTAPTYVLRAPGAAAKQMARAEAAARRPRRAPAAPAKAGKRESPPVDENEHVNSGVSRATRQKHSR